MQSHIKSITRSIKYLSFITLSILLSVIFIATPVLAAQDPLVTPETKDKPAHEVESKRKSRQISDPVAQKAEVDKNYAKHMDDLLVKDVDVEYNSESFIVTFKSAPDQKTLEKISKSKYVQDGIPNKLD